MVAVLCILSALALVSRVLTLPVGQRPDAPSHKLLLARDAELSASKSGAAQRRIRVVRRRRTVDTSLDASSSDLSNDSSLDWLEDGEVYEIDDDQGTADEETSLDDDTQVVDQQAEDDGQSGGEINTTDKETDVGDDESTSSDQQGNADGSSSAAVSTDGTCGVAAGKQAKRCPQGTCCSKYGYCGTTDDHCMVNQGCNALFGICKGPTSGSSPSPGTPAQFPAPDARKAAKYIDACTKPRTFALTFDDGPSQYFARLLDVLKAKNVKATFFVNGKNYADLTQAADKAKLKRAFDEGHQIASHTLTHVDLTTVDTARIWQEMTDNDSLIKDSIGKRPTYMRPPFGSYSQPILNALGTWGYKVIGWNADSKDFEHTGKANFMQLNQMSYDSDLKSVGAVIPGTPLLTLQHDHVPEDSTPDGWAAKVIDKYRALGYKFVTVGECLGDSSAGWYHSSAADPRCGPQGGNARCANNLCCSYVGYCNNTPEHCGAGCQAAFGRCGLTSTSSPTSSPTPAVDPRCGPQGGNAVCANNMCCSYLGYCNNTPAHCGTGCQTPFGRCGTASTTSAPKTTSSTTRAATSTTSSATSPTPSVDPRCGPQGGNAVCANNMCCSYLGYCNNTPAHCGTGCQTPFGRCDSTTPSQACGSSAGGASCPDNQCCSYLGFCGTTEVHCGISCQQLFGRCGFSTMPASAPVGSFPAPVASKAAAFINRCTQDNVFALTFDDGPSQYFARLLDVLKAKNVKVTFFVNGKNRGDLDRDADKANLKRAFDEGHQIASHTLTHIDLAVTNSSQMWSQMKINDDLIKAVIGKRPVYMRPPFGRTSTGALTALGTWGYKVIGWNADSKDFEHIGKPDFIALDQANYDSDLQSIGAVIPGTSLMTLQHDYVPEDSQTSGWAEYVINKYTALGYKFVTVGECLRDSPANWYRD
ncbi:hypothetical protein HK105_205206 [Polyrhizophydium stewartii]|uniref:Chitooligosaccharide deacetylase n=1 Tax=Polyrhizophydium stewartii TaxID=2732419 RepID=A0ABR4N727_9FUNG